MTQHTERRVATLQSKEQAWATLRNNKLPVNPNFYWIQHDCTPIHPTKMRTFHLFASLKMIWNNMVPEHMRIQPYRKWGGIPQMDRGYRRQAVANLFNELMNRPDRTPGMEEAMREMAKHVAKVGAKLLR